MVVKFKEEAGNAVDDFATKFPREGNFFSLHVFKFVVTKRTVEQFVACFKWIRSHFQLVFKRERGTIVPGLTFNMLGFTLRIAQNGFSSTDVDGIIYVSPQASNSTSVFSSTLKAHEKIDEGFNSDVSVLPLDGLPAGRLVYSPISNISDYDDVRCFAEAAAKGIKRALKAGIKNPLLYLPEYKKFPNSQLVTLLGALEALYVPIQLREDVPEKRSKVKSLTVYADNVNALPDLVREAEILECGRIICRDIGGGDPERMAAPRIEEYVRNVFAQTNIKMEVISDQKIFLKEYPLFAAVNRAASAVERHRGRIIYLTYEPEGNITRTLGVVGKGITYDTGGADIKTGGMMLGMSRDKCGAAAVAGLMKIVSELKPKGVRVVGAMCIARNSVGEECYVSDEVLTSRAKVRVRVSNTDAEGRMVMADVLCKVKEDLSKYQNVHIVTVATLTGHAALTVGPYSIVVDNSVAKRNGNCYKLQEAGMSIGDPFEVSILRPEDFMHHKGTWEGDDVTQSYKTASTRSQRGHQGPTAFLLMTSGLDKHGLTSGTPLSYSHLDISGSSGDPPQEPKAASLLALYTAYIKDFV